TGWVPRWAAASARLSGAAGAGRLDAIMPGPAASMVARAATARGEPPRSTGLDISADVSVRPTCSSTAGIRRGQVRSVPGRVRRTAKLRSAKQGSAQPAPRPNERCGTGRTSAGRAVEPTGDLRPETHEWGTFPAAGDMYLVRMHEVPTELIDR